MERFFHDWLRCSGIISSLGGTAKHNGICAEVATQLRSLGVLVDVRYRGGEICVPIQLNQSTV